MADARQFDFLLAGMISIDGRQRPLANGKVYTYNAGSNTVLKATYEDANKAETHASPARLDDQGKITMFGDGLYRIVIHDEDDNEVFVIDNYDPGVLSAETYRVTAVDTAYTALSTDDLILGDATNDPFEIALPNTATLGNVEIIVKKTDSSSNGITLNPFGTNLIDGAASYIVSEQYDAVVLRSYGEADGDGNWHIIGIKQRVISAGTIVIWSGAISAIPTGWVICDGTNSTPNLTGKFVVHADADAAGTYNVGDTGGSNTHSHAGTGSTGSAAAAGVTDPSSIGATSLQSGGNKAYTGGADSFVALDGSVYTIGGGSNLDYWNGTVTGGSHTHGLTGTAHTHTAGAVASSDNRSPYHALAYIMRT